MNKEKLAEIFLKNAHRVHGDKYDFSEMRYINSSVKITVICKKHGPFEITPSYLLTGYGCPTCQYEKSGKKSRLTIEDFMERSNKVHNNKYDYSKVKYINNSTKVCIICPEHGEFWQAPDKHMSGKGCPYCAGNARLTNEVFIERSKVVHNNKYDYSKVDVRGTHNKVCIICPEHGEFWQAPNDHLHGQGCPKCRGKRVWDTRGRFTVEEVKKQLIEKHGDEYDYSLFTEYKNNGTKIPIICKKHGIFYQTTHNHLAGKGCPKCKFDKISEMQRLDIDEVKKRITEVHGDRFEIPDDFEYENNQTKVKLICKEHGEFWQNPFNLWRGVGCPKCNRSKLESEISLFLDRNEIEYEEQKKFDWLGNYELDFYLPQHNIAIECQGIQHFRPVELFGGDEQFKKQVEWDKEKERLCNEKGIKILYYTTNYLKKQYGINTSLIASKKELIEEIRK